MPWICISWKVNALAGTQIDCLRNAGTPTAQRQQQPSSHWPMQWRKAFRKKKQRKIRIPNAVLHWKYTSSRHIDADWEFICQKNTSKHTYIYVYNYKYVQMCIQKKKKIINNKTKANKKSVRKKFRSEKSELLVFCK